jgi:hypothetical protein
LLARAATGIRKEKQSDGVSEEGTWTLLADRNVRKEEGGHRKNDSLFFRVFKQKLIGLIGYSDFEFLVSPESKPNP